MITDVISRGPEFDIQSVYDPTFVSFIKAIPGTKWNSISKTWTLPLYASEVIMRDGRQFIPSQYILDKLISVMSIINYPLPQNLKTPLWDSLQELGYRFLLTREKCILADIMGMGKKAQSLAAVLYLMQSGARSGRINKTVIVSIKPDLFQWYDPTEKEGILKFIPIDKDLIVMPKGSKRDRQLIYQQFVDDPALKFLVLNYEKAVTTEFDVIVNSLQKESCIILDECAYIKNYTTKRSKSILRLQANYKFALSGTPVQNSPADVYNINRFLDNNSLGPYYDFLNRYAITSNIMINGRLKRVITGWRNLYDIHRRIGPLILRRDVNPYVHEPITKTIHISLQSSEVAVYDFIKNSVMNQLKANADASTILPLWSIQKMFCDSPKLLMQSQAQILSTFDREIFNVDGSKFEEFTRLVDILISDPRQVVVFVSYIPMADMLRDWINNKYGPIAISYRGDTTEEEAIVPFQKGQYKFLISGNKGSHALNLPMAGILVHYDLHWNPEVMDQREGRIMRPEQGSNILILKMVVEDEDKIEQYITSKLLRKRRYSDVIIDGKI